MNKTELIKKVAWDTGLTQAKAAEVLNVLFDQVIPEAVAGGTRVQIHGFGTFYTRHSLAREGTNPHTGEKLSIPAKSRVHFKAASRLSERLA